MPGRSPGPVQLALREYLVYGLSSVSSLFGMYEATRLFLPAWISFYVFLALRKRCGKQLDSVAAIDFHFTSVEGRAVGNGQQEI